MDRLPFPNEEINIRFDLNRPGVNTMRLLYGHLQVYLSFLAAKTIAQSLVNQARCV